MVNPSSPKKGFVPEEIEILKNAEWFATKTYKQIALVKKKVNRLLKKPKCTFEEAMALDDEMRTLRQLLSNLRMNMKRYDTMDIMKNKKTYDTAEHKVIKENCVCPKPVNYSQNDNFSNNKGEKTLYRSKSYEDDKKISKSKNDINCECDTSEIVQSSVEEVIPIKNREDTQNTYMDNSLIDQNVSQIGSHFGDEKTVKECEIVYLKEKLKRMEQEMEEKFEENEALRLKFRELSRV